MKTKELVKQVLEKWGFAILKEINKKLVFRYQMNAITMSVIDVGENNVVALFLSGVFSADNDDEYSRAIRVCNDLNNHMILAKLFIDSESDLTIATEFFYKTEDDMEFLLTMGLRALIAGKIHFLKKYDEQEDEDKLISELENEKESI